MEVGFWRSGRINSSSMKFLQTLGYEEQYYTLRTAQNCGPGRLPFWMFFQQGPGFIGGHGFGKVISLCVFAPEFPQHRKLFGRLHPFGNHIEPQTAGHGQDRPYDLHAISSLAYCFSEGTVDFQRVQGKAVQVAQRRITRTEVVDGELDAQRFDL